MTQPELRPIPLSRRRVAVSKSEERNQSLRSAAPIVVTVITALCLVALLSLFFLVTMPRRFTQGPLYSGTAQVESVVFSSGHKSGYTTGWITFGIAGQHVTMSLENLTDLSKLAQTRIGATVPVTYHRDKEGTIYVADWQVLRP